MKQKTTWVATDGTEFESEITCRAYDRRETIIRPAVETYAAGVYAEEGRARARLINAIMAWEESKYAYPAHIKAYSTSGEQVE